MYNGKPIIGLSGGIGAGKTFVGRLFGELGCLVISSDELVRQVYLDPQLKTLLKEWWGGSIFTAEGEVDRAAVAAKIFGCESDRQRLEGLLHPRVAQLREAKMRIPASDGAIAAFVWDTPLLFETGLAEACDATVFVDAPEPVRLSRLSQSRGWEAGELAAREKSQLPLDKKRAMSNYIVVNTTDAESTRVQVRELLSRILAGASSRM